MTENKYQNGKIYKIISYSHPDLVYYGSTTQPLYKRIHQHRTDQSCACKHILEFDDATILLVENYACNSKEELNKKEGEYILNNVCVNKNVAGRTPKEYWEANKEKKAEKNKKYREKHKEKITETTKKYREEHQDKIIKYREEHRDAMKLYRKENKDKIKKYFDENKIKISQQSKKRKQQPYTCECGVSMISHSKAPHMRTQKHLTFVSSSQK